METLERLQHLLLGLDELRTIVRTMKALSATNIRQYDEAVSAVRTYYATVNLGLQAVLRFEGPPQEQRQRGSRTAAIGTIVFGSDHGLCGRFNEVISEHTVTHLQSTGVDPVHRRMLAVGARVAANLQHGGVAVQDTLLVPSAPAGITGTVRDLLLRVDRWREEDNVQQVTLLYNQRTDANTARPTTAALLPVDPAHLRSLHEAPWPARGLPTHSMARADLLRRLLHQYLFVLLHRACAESIARAPNPRPASTPAAWQRCRPPNATWTTDSKK
jgi:F-type H+-transporting ATPase subunit gamma